VSEIHLPEGAVDEGVYGSSIHRLLGRRAAGRAVLAGALALVVLIGALGVGSRQPTNLDMHFLYAAGLTWMHGMSPYTLAEYRETTRSYPAIDKRVRIGFAYPPHIAAFCVFLALMPLSLAQAVMTGLNLAALWIICYLAFLLSSNGADEDDTSDKWMIAAVVAGNPFSLYVIYSGQTTLVVTACLLGAWWLGRDGRHPVLGGFVLALASMKPQVAALPVVWLLLEQRYQLRLAFTGTVIALVAAPIALSGRAHMVAGWLAAMGRYSSGPYQSVGSDHVFGIASLLMSAEMTAYPAAILVVPAVAILWSVRKRLLASEVLGALVGLGLLFLYSHDYDLAALAPLYAAIWVRTRERTSYALVGLLACLLLFVPQRALRGHVSPPIMHWREVVLAISLFWLFTRALLSRAAPTINKQRVDQRADRFFDAATGNAV
jgi:glycosyl transferase family 87